MQTLAHIIPFHLRGLMQKCWKIAAGQKFISRWVVDYRLVGVRLWNSDKEKKYICINQFNIRIQSFNFTSYLNNEIISFSQRSSCEQFYSNHNSHRRIKILHLPVSFHFLTIFRPTFYPRLLSAVSTYSNPSNGTHSGTFPTRNPALTHQHFRVIHDSAKICLHASSSPSPAPPAMINGYASHLMIYSDVNCRHIFTLSARRLALCARLRTRCLPSQRPQNMRKKRGKSSFFRKTERISYCTNWGFWGHSDEIRRFGTFHPSHLI